MQLPPDHIAGLNTALEEAQLISVEVMTGERVVGVTLSVQTLPDHGPVPEDSRVLLELAPVGRIAASWRRGPWNDRNAEVVPFSIEQLGEVVEKFRGQAIYGAEFFDAVERKNLFRRPVEGSFSTWEGRLSLDWRSGPNGDGHTLDLFQETDEHLDLRIWFDELQVRDPKGASIEIEEFIAGGRRWWQAWSSDDPRTQGAGIVRLR